MVKKVAPVVAAVPKAEAVADVEEENLTVKQKKLNALNMAKAVKKFNAKIKKSLDKKQLVKAV